jgi:protein TonB
MRCLSDVEIQILVDAEADEVGRSHAAMCRRCGSRVWERRRDMTSLSALMSVADDVSAARNTRILRAIGRAHLAPRPTGLAGAYWAPLVPARSGTADAWLGSEPALDRWDRRRLGPAMIGSLVFHGLLLALLIVAGIHKVKVIEQQQDPSMKFDVAFLQQKGPGGGGGGAPRPAPRKQLEIPKTKPVDPIPIPAPPPLQSPPELNVPVQTNLAQTLQASGSSAVSLLPVGGGGRGTGIGSGIGDGLGEGSGGGAGGGVYEIGNGVSSPVPIRTSDPTYTSDAMRAKVQGEVHLEAVVQSNGLLTNIKITKSLDRTYGLDQAAVEAARKWLFRPGMKDGKAVPVHVQLILEFRLH